MDDALTAFANFRLGFSENLSRADRVGRLIIACQWDGPWVLSPGHLVVKHADLRILISAKLARMIAGGDCHPGIKIYTIGNRAGFVGGKVEIHARDRKLIYVITGYDAASDAYEAEWPD